MYVIPLIHFLRSPSADIHPLPSLLSIRLHLLLSLYPCLGEMVQVHRANVIDAANDTYASYLIYQTLVRLAHDRGIDLDLDEFSTDQGDIPESLGAKMARRSSGSLAPTPAQERVIGLFVAGEEVGVIASSMGIKEGTVL